VVCGLIACVSYTAIWICGWVVAGFADPGTKEQESRTFSVVFEEFSTPVFLGLVTFVLPFLVVGATANSFVILPQFLLDCARTIAQDERFRPLCDLLFSLSWAASVLTEPTPWYWRIPAVGIVLIFVFFVSWFVIAMLGELLFGWHRLLRSRGFPLSEREGSVPVRCSDRASRTSLDRKSQSRLPTVNSSDASGRIDPC
jgi:hypothetical protein